MKIDFVIPWVDGNDENWKKEKEQTLGLKTNTSSDIIRFRDWDNLKYIFRGIENNASWVNKVYFITWGHIPNWLNVNHPKLKIIKHTDYLPKKYLPTYSSHVLELNFHRIKDLEEHFVYLNDDTFIIDKVSPNDFFKDGKPVDSAILTAIVPAQNPIIEHVLVNNISVINKYFNMKKVIFKNFGKWFNLKYGTDQIRSLLLLPWNNFPGLKFNHLPSALLKSTYTTLWNKEYEILDSTCMHKLRTELDVNQYLLKNWQIVTNNFYPMRKKFGNFYAIQDDNQKITDAICKKKYKILCINDSEEITNFEKAKEEINSALEYIYPNRSSFERSDMENDKN